MRGELRRAVWEDVRIRFQPHGKSQDQKQAGVGSLPRPGLSGGFLGGDPAERLLKGLGTPLQAGCVETSRCGHLFSGRKRPSHTMETSTWRCTATANGRVGEWEGLLQPQQAQKTLSRARQGAGLLEAGHGRKEGASTAAPTRGSGTGGWSSGSRVYQGPQGLRVPGP